MFGKVIISKKNIKDKAYVYSWLYVCLLVFYLLEISLGVVITWKIGIFLFGKRNFSTPKNLFLFKY